MASLTAILFSYFLGGVTFIPLILAIVVFQAYYTLPLPRRRDAGYIQVPQDLKESHEPDVAAAYFAVCREYIPGGVNGKPPERTTPAGTAIAAESPSVYQSIYKSFFDRGKVQSSTLDAGKQVKKFRNVFFVVLRHGHLVLFDTSEQVEIRHVISLEHHEVDVYAGGEETKEGELWIKRNCIRLRHRSEGNTASAPFFLFSENCSEKEDFYHAIIGSQGQHRPLGFPTDDMIKLIRQLHASEENAQTRWLNALIGRVFLALYKTSDVEHDIRDKITKKISRVAKPAFISNLRLEEIDMGDSGPFFLNPKLREMTVDGTLTIETDVRYMGNFKAVIAANARLDLGAHFKAREVDIILAGVLKKLEGHLLIKIKPPPSNRIWISFDTVPKLDISLEPIVSSRQITYGVILRAIQSRIREVFSETLVLPNWDDIPFTNSEHVAVRGGIWKEDAAVSRTEHLETFAKIGEARSDRQEGTSEGLTGVSSDSVEESQTLPASPSMFAAPSQSSRLPKHDKPKAMRSNSFATAADPVISKSPMMTDGLRRQNRKGQQNAKTAMRTLAKHSPEESPVAKPDGQEIDTPSKTLPPPSLAEPPSGHEIPKVLEPTGQRLRMRGTSMTDPGTLFSGSSTLEKSKALNQSLTTATVAAKNWGWGMLGRPGERSTFEKPNLSEPMGRGQPLPPPGVPLPRPDRSNNWAFSSLRRKPVGQNIGQSSSVSSFSTPAPGPERSMNLKPQRNSKRQATGSGDEPESLLTVVAPEDSPPGTPASETREGRDYCLPDFELGVSEPLQHSPEVAGNDDFTLSARDREEHSNASLIKRKRASLGENSPLHRRSVSHDTTFALTYEI